MTFDLTPEQQALVSRATSITTLPTAALDAVLVVEEQVRQSGDASVRTLTQQASPVRARLLAAAAAVGIGRAAVADAVAFMKTHQVTPGPDTAVPHWSVADGATDVEAARLLTYAAAQSADRGDAAESLAIRALEFASRAAQRAVDAAIRVAGAGGLTEGGLLDRLSRDVRALQVILR